MNYTKLIEFLYQIILQNLGQMNLCINPGMINPISIISLILALVSSEGKDILIEINI